MIERLCEQIREDIRNRCIDFERVDLLADLIQKESDEKKKTISESLFCELGDDDDINIWLYSYALRIYPNQQVFRHWIEYIRVIKHLNYKKKYFLFQQINAMIFKYPLYNTDDIISAAWSLLDTISSECKYELKLNLKEIPPDERSGNISLVLVEQFLSAEHGPTKTALDRSYVLKKYLGQNVMIINTAELLSPANVVCIEGLSEASYFDALCQQPSVSWQNEEFLYYQCGHDMPSDNGIKELVEFIYNLKPASVVLVGGTSLVAGLINEMIPVITVGTTQSGIAITESKYQIIDKNMLDKGYRILDILGKDRKHIIPGKFTFSLKPQSRNITRHELGIDKDQFAIAVVGARLTDEITDEFLEMLEKCLQDGMVVGIIGRCLDFDIKIQKHSSLKDKMINIGFVDDILAVIENFDLYVNPIRRGGGTSAIEAMSKGIPVLTVNYGDVAGVAGKDFQCESYEEMAILIDKYRKDQNFYNKQSQLAKQVADVYLDSKKEFCRIMNVYQSMVLDEEKRIERKRKIKIKIALLHGAKINAGDHLIKERTKALLKYYYPDCEITEFYRNQSFTDETLAEINKNQIAILAGGPGYYDDFYPRLAPMRASLDDIKIPMMMIGMGWFGFDGEPYSVYNYKFGEKMQALLNRVERDSTILGCRDFQSMHVLRNNGYQKVLMAGCPAWYDLNYVHMTSYMGKGIEKSQKICISDCGNSDNLPQLIEVMDFVRNFFGKDKEIWLVVHRGIDEEIRDEMLTAMNRNQILLREITGSLDGFKVYDDCDLHIGFRVHAHIYNMSQRRLSILIEEDARGYGVNEAMGLPHIRTFWSLRQDDMAIHMRNQSLATQLSDYLFDLYENNYCQMDHAYSLMRKYFVNMERHIKSIEKLI